MSSACSMHRWAWSAQRPEVARRCHRFVRGALHPIEAATLKPLGHRAADASRPDSVTDALLSEARLRGARQFSFGDSHVARFSSVAFAFFHEARQCSTGKLLVGGGSLASIPPACGRFRQHQDRHVRGEGWPSAGTRRRSFQMANACSAGIDTGFAALVRLPPPIFYPALSSFMAVVDTVLAGEALCDKHSTRAHHDRAADEP